MSPPESLRSTLDLLANRWAGVGRLLPAFSLLAGGEPLLLPDLADSIGLDRTTLDALLGSARSERDEKGRLVDLFGMGLRPTLHEVRAGRGSFYSCCALWAHVIPRLLETSVEVRSTDPVTRQLVVLDVLAAGVQNVDPGTFATVATATAEEIEADIAAAFCDNVCHFRCRESAEQFATRRPRRQVITVVQLNDAARYLLESIHVRSSALRPV